MEERILILAPRGRDAQVIGQVLDRRHLGWAVCADARALLAEMDRGASAALVTEEGLSSDDVPLLRSWIDAQPAWADFPFILLSPWQARQPGAERRGLADLLGNVVVLERPINAETLVSAAMSALRARRRQYEARAHWIERDNNERNLRMAMMAGNLGSWTLCPSSMVLTGSDRFKAHFGREADAPFSHDDLLAAIHADDVERHHAATEAAFAGRADYRLEARVTWPDKTMHWIQISGRLNTADGNRNAALAGVSLDVTERRRAEEMLQQRVDEAIGESQRAQAALVQSQKMEAVGQLTAGIAHDFNNLLTAIIGNVDLISRRTSDERIKAMASRARHASDRAAKLTGQLLAFSRNQQLNLRPVAIDGLVSGMRELLARSIGPSIAIETGLAAPDGVAMADANQIELALLNLAINARDAMPKGGSLCIATRIEPARSRDGAVQDFVVVAVADTGSGIAPDVLPKVFDPFFTTKPLGKGTGLGLSQVHGIAHQSGGSVKIHSEVGRGTTIEIWLRRTEARQLAEDGRDAAAAVPGRGHVLVIDDDPDVRRFVVDCLESLGYLVTQAEHGKAGLERLDIERPDVMIVDFSMPGMNGAQVAAAARDRQAGLPIILATGYAEAGLVSDTFAQEAILRKPFEIDELSRAVRHALHSA